VLRKRQAKGRADPIDAQEGQFSVNAAAADAWRIADWSAALLTFRRCFGRGLDNPLFWMVLPWSQLPLPASVLRNDYAKVSTADDRQCFEPDRLLLGLYSSAGKWRPIGRRSSTPRRNCKNQSVPLPVFKKHADQPGYLFLCSFSITYRRRGGMPVNLNGRA